MVCQQKLPKIKHECKISKHKLLNLWPTSTMNGLIIYLLQCIQEFVFIDLIYYIRMYVNLIKYEVF